MKSTEEELDDYVWGRIKEQPYLMKVVGDSSLPMESMYRRAQQIEENLNKHIRKGVEENLSKLLDQATALEELDRTQRCVNSQMEHIYQKSESLSGEMKDIVDKLVEKQKRVEELRGDKMMIEDMVSIIDLMRTFEKRTEIVKRSEIICEIEGILADNPAVSKLNSMKELVNQKFKAAQNQVRTSASEDLRRALLSLNGSLVASAVRALTNLKCLQPELDTQLSRSIAEVDGSLDVLAKESDPARALITAVNVLQSQIEQWSLLGHVQLTRFCERCARSIRTRVQPTAPYALRFVQQLSRCLSGRQPSIVSPINDALKPIKKELLSQGLTRITKLINEHDFTDGHSHAFVDILNGALQEEQSKVEWDGDMKDEFGKNIKKALDLVVVRLEKELKMEPENLLLGDRLLSSQHSNYRLLGVAGLLTSKWTQQASALRDLQNRTLTTIFEAVRTSITAILSSMHNETLGGKEVSPYMDELLAYLERVGGHCAHLGPCLRVTSVLGPLVDFTLETFLIHASLVSPMPPDVRAQLSRDACRLFDSCTLLQAPSLFGDARPIATLFASDHVESLKEVPGWLLVHVLISQSPSTLKRPHESVDWTHGEYVQWLSQQNDEERYRFLSNLMSSYASSVVSRGETQYVTNYPRIMSILEVSSKS